MKTLNFEHILIFVAISIFPLYFFDSGSLQVSHYFLILFSVFVFFNRGFFIANKIYFLLLFTFLGYMAFRQFIFLIEFNKLNLMPIVFFIFNLCIFFTLGSYISRNYDYLIDFLKYPIYISIFLVFVGFYFTGLSLVNIEPNFNEITQLNGGNMTYSGERYRAVGTFNNPNQLGLFSVCIGGLVTYLFLTERINNTEFYLLCSFVVLMVAASLSKAAMISILGYGLIFFQKKYIKHLGVILLIIFSFFMILLNYVDLEDIKIFNRILSIGQNNDDSLISRGYGPLFEPDLRLIYGWGEGFSSLTIGNEVHSTLGNILISYGLIGIILFGLFIFYVFLRVKNMSNLLFSLALILPSMLYGITHNGIRFTIFWVLFSILAFAPNMDTKSKNHVL